MALKDTGAFHLAAFDEANLYQPVRTNNFRFLVEFDTEFLKFSKNNQDEYWQPEKSKEVIDFSVVSFDVPHFTQSEVEINRGNSKIFFAGKASFNSGNLKINDFAGANGKSILESWQALSYNPQDDTIPSAENYKKNATIIEMMPDGTINRSWELYGCWITKIDESAYDNDNPSKKVVTATIRYDKAIPTLGND